MNKTIKECAYSVYDNAVGPILDAIGSKGGRCIENPDGYPFDTRVLVDRRSNEEIGSVVTIWGDGVARLSRFNKPTILRTETNRRIEKLLRV